MTVLVNGRAVARISSLETPVWVADEQVVRIYGTVVDAGWEDELHSAREEDIVAPRE